MVLSPAPVPSALPRLHPFLGSVRRSHTLSPARSQGFRSYLLRRRSDARLLSGNPPAGFLPARRRQPLPFRTAPQSSSADTFPVPQPAPCNSHPNHTAPGLPSTTPPANAPVHLLRLCFL